jgi:hypothetical protein
MGRQKLHAVQRNPRQHTATDEARSAETAVRTRVVAQVDDIAVHAVHLPSQQRRLHSAPGVGREVVDPDVGRLPAVAQRQSRLQCKIGIWSVISPDRASCNTFEAVQHCRYFCNWRQATPSGARRPDLLHGGLRQGAALEGHVAWVPCSVGDLQIHPQASRPSQQRRHLVLRQPRPLHMVVVCSIRREQCSGTLYFCRPVSEQGKL